MAQIGQDINQAAKLLMAGKLIGMPTETVYGLAGNGLAAESVAQIFAVKDRPYFDPLILHFPDLRSVKPLVREFPAQAEALAKAFWPGPLTLVLPKSEQIPDLVTSGLPHVAVRVPGHPLALSLLRQLPFPLAAPSANPFGFISPTTAGHVAAQLGAKIPYILDGGPCQVGLESTIVSFAGEMPRVLRKGGLPLEAIRAKIGEVQVHQSSSSRPDAPGMLQKHYAPTKPFMLGDLQQLLEQFANKQSVIITFEKPLIPLPETVSRVFCLSEKGSLTEAAQRLFSTMRQADTCNVEVILAQPVPNQGLGLAINDRLRRAAAPSSAQ